ncbi:MAG: hypothetical protein L0191_18820, partial [Acidobacteria bacterium]|nr:hypothetical protein [Acidobacteriota bacterium]
MRFGKIVALSVVVGLAFTAAWEVGPAFGEEKLELSLERSLGVERGNGKAVIADNTMTIRVSDLKPNSVYTVWYVNMEPKHEMAGVGSSPYMFKTDRQGKATFKA